MQKEIVLEESETPEGVVVQLVRLPDGREQQRRFRYTCPICGKLDKKRPFSTSPLGCLRSDCEH